MDNTLTTQSATLDEIHKVVSRFITPVHIINHGMVMMFDAYRNSEEIAECLYHMDVNQKNLADCYEGCSDDVVIHREGRVNPLPDF